MRQVELHDQPCSANALFCRMARGSRLPWSHAGDGARVMAAYAAWLRWDGWVVREEVDFVDVYAERGEERLYAEAKGRAASIGLDVDTQYGQLLRRLEHISCRLRALA